MPSFPAERYESKNKLTTQQPSAMQEQVATQGQITGEYAKVFGKAADETLKWSKAVDDIQQTADQTSVKMKYMDLLQQAEDDPTTANQKERFEELKKIRAAHGKGFQNMGAASENSMKLDLLTKSAEIQMQGIYKKKFIAEGQAAALQNINIEVANPTAYSSEYISDFIDKQVETGIFAADDGYKMKVKADNDIKFNSFLRDFRSDPVGTEKKFQKNAYGMDIEQAEKARSKLKELKAIFREQEGNVYGDMSLRLMTGELPEDEIDTAIAMNKKNPNEGITEAHGKQLKAALYRDITKRIGQKEFKRYREAIDYVFADSTQDKIKGYEAVLAAYQDGLTGEESNFLKNILDTKKDVIFANKAAAGKKIIEQLLGARPKNVQDEAKHLLTYAKRIANGMAPEVASRETVLDIVQKDHPAVVNDPDLAVAFTPGKGLKNIPKVKRESAT